MPPTPDYVQRFIDEKNGVVTERTETKLLSESSKPITEPESAILKWAKASRNKKNSLSSNNIVMKLFGLD